VPRHSEATLAAIKNAVDIVTLVGDYLPLTRSGSKFKALCPFHDDHNPSLELNPDRQSYKCWSCGATGDVFDFVKEYERVEFPEALRMLAERAGIALESPSAAAPEARGPSKTELLAVNAWAEGVFREALSRSGEARGYVAGRGITEASAARFKLGYAPGVKGWLLAQARKAGFPADVLERAGLVTRPAGDTGPFRERFRGRLVFPIHDPRGRAIGFGGRVLPEVERFLAASGKNVAKYLNSPETPLFQKRRVLYAWDLARPAAREAGWVAVVEGYTDVIAAHQVGLSNVVGTLGTALGDGHVAALRRLADRVVLIFDGDAAGQNAADRALEIFLGHEVDVRVLTLPENLDPCDFLLREGAGAFRALVDRAVDPLAFALRRAEALFDIASPEGSRKAADWLLGVVARVPVRQSHGLEVKVDKALDFFSHRLSIPAKSLRQLYLSVARSALRARKRPAARAGEGAEAQAGAGGGSRPRPLDPASLNREDREVVEILLNRPDLVPSVIDRVAVNALRDEPLRALLRLIYDVHSEGQLPSFEALSLRIEDPDLKAFASGLLFPADLTVVNRHPIDPTPMPANTAPAPWDVRLNLVLSKLALREWQNRLNELRAALSETSEVDDPATHQALKTEYLRLLTQRPDTKTKTAS
jgi:DNA primase